MKAAFWSVVLIASIILLFSSCASFKGKPYAGHASEDARHAIESIKSSNAGLSSIKGLGNVKIINEDIQLNSRFAWVTSSPDKIRMNIFDVSGKPLATVASDGERVYFLSHTDNQFYNKSVSSGTLKKFLSISISLDDILLLFSGRVPIHDHFSAILDQENTVLTLSGRTRVIEKIYFESETITPHKIEIFGGDGVLLYKARFEQRIVTDGFSLPGVVAISDDNGSLFRIQVDRYWPNAAVSDSIFVIEGPEIIGSEN